CHHITTPFVARALPPPSSMCHVMSRFCSAPCAWLARADELPVVLHADDAPALRRARRPDLWCADGLGHTVEDHDALTAAARRGRFISAREAAVDVLPVVHRPDVSCRIDGNISLHLQAAAHVAARW